MYQGINIIIMCKRSLLPIDKTDIKEKVPNTIPILEETKKSFLIQL